MKVLNAKRCQTGKKKLKCRKWQKKLRPWRNFKIIFYHPILAKFGKILRKLHFLEFLCTERKNPGIQAIFYVCSSQLFFYSCQTKLFMYRLSVNTFYVCQSYPYPLSSISRYCKHSKNSVYVHIGTFYVCSTIQNPRNENYFRRTVAPAQTTGWISTKFGMGHPLVHVGNLKILAQSRKKSWIKFWKYWLKKYISQVKSITN